MALVLTQGERVMIGRARDGMTQGDFARDELVSQSRVSRWEADRSPVPRAIRDKYKRLGRLTALEILIVMRRRVGMSVEDAAQQFGASRYHVIKIESGRVQSDAYLTFIRDQYNASMRAVA